MPHPIRALLLGSALCALLGACQDYLARRDTLSAASGEAVHANMVAHTIDPWSPASRTLESTTNGERLQHAMERYRNPGSGANVTALPPVPVGPGSVPPASGSTLR